MNASPRHSAGECKSDMKRTREAEEDGGAMKIEYAIRKIRKGDFWKESEAISTHPLPILENQALMLARYEVGGRCMVRSGKRKYSTFAKSHMGSQISYRLSNFTPLIDYLFCLQSSPSLLSWTIPQLFASFFFDVP